MFLILLSIRVQDNIFDCVHKPKESVSDITFKHIFSRLSFPYKASLTLLARGRLVLQKPTVCVTYIFIYIYFMCSNIRNNDKEKVMIYME